MDLASPLRSLIPSLDSGVLEVLVGVETPLSVAQITALSPRGSRQGLTLALDRLVKHGLVIATPANRGSMYHLNREHVLADAVASASGARATVRNRLADSVALMQPPPVHASLFGSFARGEAHTGSDIDVLFVLPDPPGDAWFDQLGMLATKVQAWTGNRLEYLVFGREEFQRVIDRGEPIVSSWINDCVTVHGMTLDALLADVGRGRGRGEA